MKRANRKAARRSAAGVAHVSRRAVSPLVATCIAGAPALPPKQPVLGVGISATNYGQMLRLCRQWVEQRRQDPAKSRNGHCIFVCTVNAVMTAVLRPPFRTLLNSGDVATTDGMPLAWALRSFGVRKQPRVYGPDLMLALCGQATRLGHRIYLFGGRKEVIEVLPRNLSKRFPGIRIAGCYPSRNPPSTPQADREAIAAILSSGADIVFVGFGQPRQEQWIVDHRDLLPGVVLAGVGAAFDFHAGRVRQAPRWMQRSGLEWFFRLLSEPLRLWRRYILFNPLFLMMWGLQLAGLLRYAARGQRRPEATTAG